MVSLDSELCSLNSGNLSGSTCGSPTAPWPGNSLKAISRINYRIHLIFFLFLKDHCSSLPVASCLEQCCFVYVCGYFFECFEEEGKSDPCYTILAGINLHLERVLFGYYFIYPMGPGSSHFRKLMHAKYIYFYCFVFLVWWGFLFCFVLFLGCPCSIQRFLDQGSNWCHRHKMPDPSPMSHQRTLHQIYFIPTFVLLLFIHLSIHPSIYPSIHSFIIQ